ncbi:hypothetical protein M9H77_12544 [Catharanthus roseus]|uniref:Uncharacterized protein n=1 Tax=Catharanthus roseus TaxID=4058 RepID=A0ACC0BHS3_CATRO|nr:hypothetical protein M9H77_12544 [Catharanthus roseus]
MVLPYPFPYGAFRPLVIGLHCRLWHCLTVRSPANTHPRRVIVKFGCALEMCYLEGLNFGWFIEAFPYKVDCHLVAPDAETRMSYWGFGIVYSTPQFDGFIVLPAFLIEIDELEESSDE